jgi:hypothetical protein
MADSPTGSHSLSPVSSEEESNHSDRYLEEGYRLPSYVQAVFTHGSLNHRNSSSSGGLNQQWVEWGGGGVTKVLKPLHFYILLYIRVRTHTVDSFIEV